MLDYCESLTPEIEVESSVNDSTNPVQSKAVAKALAAKQDADILAKVATSGSYGDLKDKPTFATVNGKRIDQGGNIQIEDGEGGSIDPAILEGYTPLLREFSDEFNNDFTS